MLTQRAYKFRFYPTDEQRQQLAIDFGCCRFVWNTALFARNLSYKAYGRSENGISLSKAITELKKDPDYAWLNDAAATALGQTLRDQDKAFANFFAKRARYPRFRKKGTHNSARYQRQGKPDLWYIPGSLLKLPKLGALDVRWSRLPTGIPKMVTLNRDGAERYFVSFAVEEAVESLPERSQSIGVDRGIKDVLVRSDGQKSGNPHYIRKYARQLKLAQRALARGTLGSARWKKKKAKVVRLQAKIADCRRDFQHKQTTQLIRDAGTIALEDLHIKGMIRNKHLSKSLADSSMGEIGRQLEYKAAWYGREIVKCDRWAPTSKTCPDCGYKMKNMDLNIRAWVCPQCGAHHDRDIAAARNVLIFATGGYPGIARGAGHKPKAATLAVVSGRPAEKREHQKAKACCNGESA